MLSSMARKVRWEPKLIWFRFTPTILRELHSLCLNLTLMEFQLWLSLITSAPVNAKWIFQMVCTRWSKNGVKIMVSWIQDMNAAISIIRELLWWCPKTQLDIDAQLSIFQQRTTSESQWISVSIFTSANLTWWDPKRITMISKSSSTTLDQTDLRNFCLNKLTRKSEPSPSKSKYQKLEISNQSYA